MDGKFSWKKTRGKTTTEMGRRQEGLFFAAECKETSRGEEYLEANY